MNSKLKFKWILCSWILSESNFISRFEISHFCDDLFHVLVWHGFNRSKDAKFSRCAILGRYRKLKDPKNTCLPVVGHGTTFLTYVSLQIFQNAWNRDFNAIFTFSMVPLYAHVGFILPQNHLNRVEATDPSIWCDPPLATNKIKATAGSGGTLEKVILATKSRFKAFWRIFGID